MHIFCTYVYLRVRSPCTQGEISLSVFTHSQETSTTTVIRIMLRLAPYGTLVSAHRVPSPLPINYNDDFRGLLYVKDEKPAGQSQHKFISTGYQAITLKFIYVYIKFERYITRKTLTEKLEG
jgi:hypothetical protein